MRLLAIPATVLLLQAPAAFASTLPAPFDAVAVPDAELASVAGMGDPRARTPFRLTDDVAAAVQRQNASVGATIKDLWQIDVASPLIAANVRAASLR